MACSQAVLLGASGSRDSVYEELLVQKVLGTFILLLELE